MDNSILVLMINARGLLPHLLHLGAARAYLGKAAPGPKRQGESPFFCLGAACRVLGSRAGARCLWLSWNRADDQVAVTLSSQASELNYPARHSAFYKSREALRHARAY